MDSEKYPAFAEALRQFQEFLSRQGVSENILWIFREDIAENGKRKYLRIPSQEQRSFVERLYAAGCKRQLGVCFSVYCFLDKRPCCYLYVPANKTDAEYMMMPDGLRFSTPSEEILPIAISVKSRWLWMGYKLMQKPIFADELLPRRSSYAKKCA